MDPRHHLSFCVCNTAWLAPELLVSMGPNPNLWVLHAKQRLLEKNYKYLCVTALTCGFCIHNSAFWTRISCLYGSQTSSVVFEYQTASFGPELQVSMGPRPHLPLCAIKTAWFAPEYQVYNGSSPHLWFCACKTATLGPDLKVCMGPRPHLWFWANITAYLAQQ